MASEPARLGHVVLGGGASGTQRPELSFGVGQGGLRQAQRCRCLAAGWVADRAVVGAEIHAVVAQRVDALVGGEVLEGVLDAPATAQEVHEAGRSGGELGGQDLEHAAVGFHDAELAGRAVAEELDRLVRDPVVAPGAVVEDDPAAPWGGRRWRRGGLDGR